MDRSILLALMFVVLLPAYLAAGGAREADVDVEVPEDPRDEYVVGFQAFETEGISEANPRLATILPHLLREEFSELPEHRLSEEEQNAQARALLDEAVVEAGRTVDTRVDELGDLRFDTGREDKRRNKIESAKEELAEARAELAAFEAVDTQAVEITRTKPISFAGPSENASAGGARERGGEPFAADRYPSRLVRDEDLDLLISGHIEELEQTLIVTVEAYNRFLERVVYEDRVAGAPGDPEALLASLRDGLAQVLLGRPWARLSITTSSDDAAIYVDDRLIGFGEATVSYAFTGEREVSASREGFADEHRTVSLSPFESTSVELTFPSPERTEVRIDSDPAGADVYLGSVWQGVTPLTLQRPADVRTAILSEEGFLDEKIVLSPSVADEISRNLVPDQGDWPQIVESRRDEFYRAFGWFAISLPIPVMLNGMYQDIAALFPGGSPSSELSDSEAERLAATANTMLWSSRGTAAVSAGLFVNMMVQLVQYIRAGQYAH